MSGTGNLSAVIPAPSAPIADGGGNVTVPWRAWFLVVQRRTGGSVGSSPSDNTALIALERTDRIAADQALQTAIDAEAARRIAGDDTEAAARLDADAAINTLLSGVSGALGNEILRATTAEALLLPITALCSTWATCDLSFLPTSDPGSGRPWNDAGHLAIGSGTTLVDLGLEDASGTWLLEDGSGSWEWG